MMNVRHENRRPLRPEATRATGRSARTRWSRGCEYPWTSARFPGRTGPSSLSSSRTRARCLCGVPSAGQRLTTQRPEATFDAIARPVPQLGSDPDASGNAVRTRSE